MDTIGNTPLIEIQTLISRPGVSIWAKCEFLNPTGSIKDRIAHYMITRAERSGRLRPGDTLIESTSGNTGAAVAMIAALTGYHALLVIPDRVSEEKQAVLRSLGAELHVMPSQVSIHSPQHYIQVARQLAKTRPRGFYLNQYHSPHNPAAHYETTGPEIWNQMQGAIDIFVSIAGSGGTISGVGRYLKEQNPHIQIIAVDPVGSVYYDYFRTGVIPHQENILPSLVEGAGEDHLAHAMDFSVIDDIVRFKDQDAFNMARRFSQKAGVLVGGSSGANLWAVQHIAQQITPPARIVTILPDSGLKYLSKFYNDRWMTQQGFSL